MFENIELGMCLSDKVIDKQCANPWDGVPPLGEKLNITR